jgi:hypothetical protein
VNGFERISTRVEVNQRLTLTHVAVRCAFFSSSENFHP